jgi:hypothetical protein
VGNEILLQINSNSKKNVRLSYCDSEEYLRSEYCAFAVIRNPFFEKASYPLHQQVAAQGSADSGPCN